LVQDPLKYTRKSSIKTDEHLPDVAALSGNLPPAAGQHVESGGKLDSYNRYRRALADAL
jgi:hypothetical protein